MPALKIHVEFDELGKIAKTFQQHADDISAAHRRIKGAADTLEGGDWIGKGAKKFLGEMESSIHPSMQGLKDVMEEASRVTNDIGKVMHEAEEDASNAVVIIIGI